MSRHNFEIERSLKARQEYDSRLHWLREYHRLGHINDDQLATEIERLDRLAYPERYKKTALAVLGDYLLGMGYEPPDVDAAKPLTFEQIPCRWIGMWVATLDPVAFEEVVGQILNDDIWRIVQTRNDGRIVLAAVMEARCSVRMMWYWALYRASCLF